MDDATPSTSAAADPPVEIVARNIVQISIKSAELAEVNITTSAGNDTLLPSKDSKVTETSKEQKNGPSASESKATQLLEESYRRSIVSNLSTKSSKSGSNRTWNSIFQKRTHVPKPKSLLSRLRKLNNEGMMYFKQGKKLEELHLKKEAVSLYSKAHKLLRTALEIQERPNPQDFHTGHAVQNIADKLLRNLPTIEERILHLIRDDPASQRAQNGPLPKFTALSSINPLTRIPHPLKTDKENVSSSKDNSTKEPLKGADPNAKLIFSIDNGVQLFFIARNGAVATPTLPCELVIYQLDSSLFERMKRHIPMAFLSVGGWIYPLHSKLSPVLETNWGAYLFPDVSSDKQSIWSSVGVVLPSGLPDEDYSRFSIILRFFGNVAEELSDRLRDFDELPVLANIPDPDDARSDETDRRHTAGPSTVGHDSRYGAEVLKQITAKTNYLANKVVAAAGYVQARLHAKVEENRDNFGQSEVHVHEAISHGAVFAEQTSMTAIRVTTATLELLDAYTERIARYVSPQLMTQGQKIVPEVFEHSKNNKIFKETTNIAIGAFKGFVHMMAALETAASILTSSIINEAINIIHYRYGPEVADLTETMHHVLSNCSMAYSDYQALQPDSLVFNMAVRTSEVFMEDFKAISTKKGWKKPVKSCQNYVIKMDIYPKSCRDAASGTNVDLAREKALMFKRNAAPVSGVRKQIFLNDPEKEDIMQQKLDSFLSPSRVYSQPLVSPDFSDLEEIYPSLYIQFYSTFDSHKKPRRAHSCDDTSRCYVYRKPTNVSSKKQPGEDDSQSTIIESVDSSFDNEVVFGDNEIVLTFLQPEEADFPNT